LRGRIARSYAKEEISRTRMVVLMEDMDRFERHAFMPKSMLTHERFMDELGYAPPPVIRLSQIQRLHRPPEEVDDKWVRQHQSAPLTTRPSVLYGNGRQVPALKGGK
jgi:hypothetical protein